MHYLSLLKYLALDYKPRQSPADILALVMTTYHPHSLLPKLLSPIGLLKDPFVLSLRMIL